MYNVHTYKYLLTMFIGLFSQTLAYGTIHIKF